MEASVKIPPKRHRKHHIATSEWMRDLGRVFDRVALFRIEGTRARLTAGKGIPKATTHLSLSLAQSTPLRWAIEAATPVVGAGIAPGGNVIPNTLGITVPRAYAVIPLVTHRRLVALAYVDNLDAALPVRIVGELFVYCAKVLHGDVAHTKPCVRPSTQRLSETKRMRMPRPLQKRHHTGIDPVPCAELPAAQKRQSKPLGVSHMNTTIAPTAVNGLCLTPQGLKPITGLGGFRVSHVPQKLVRAGVGLAAIVFFCLMPFAPTSLWGNAHNDQVVDIPSSATISEISSILRQHQIVRSDTVFYWLARLSGVDRSLRAGTYKLPTHAWAWTVLGELHKGQVHTIDVTIPEGLSLRQIAELVEKSGITSSSRFVRAARDTTLLGHHNVPGTSFEGYLFPDTYTFAEGLSAKQMVTVMVERFFVELHKIPSGSDLTPSELRQRVILASMIEREARHPKERRRIGGVFENRIKKNMRLESCATVQYILGQPKARLRVADLRIESPYNTYLHEGLPPGPIANPGAASLAAAIAPEKHKFLFFVAREDGTHQHIFTENFAAHKLAIARVRRQRGS